MKAILWCVFLIFSLAGNVQARELVEVSVDQLLKAGASWNGQALPEYSKGQPEITILRVTIPPGVQLPLHKHPVINAGVLLKGKLKVVTEAGEIMHLEAGEPLVEVVNTWHYGVNEGMEPVEFIVFYAGTSGEAITVTAASAGE